MKLFEVEFVDSQELTDLKLYIQKITVIAATFSATWFPLVCLFITIYGVVFCECYLFFSLYGLWIIYDRRTPETGGRKWAFLKNLLPIQHCFDYFPVTLIAEEELEKGQNYLFAAFPHGYLTVCTNGCFGFPHKHFEKYFSGFKATMSTLNSSFFYPFFRDFLLSLGYISVSERSLLNYLGSEEKNRIGVVVVGGMSEVLIASPGSYKLRLKNRKGFVRVALKTGSPLVPVFGFGENDLVTAVFNNPPGSLLFKIQDAIGRHAPHFTPLVYYFNARGLFQKTFGYLGRKLPLYTIVGKPIKVPKIEQPSQDDIDKYHEMFKKSINELFEKHKYKYIEAPENAKIEFV